MNKARLLGPDIPDAEGPLKAKLFGRILQHWNTEFLSELTALYNKAFIPELRDFLKEYDESPLADILGLGPHCFVAHLAIEAGFVSVEYRDLPASALVDRISRPDLRGVNTEEKSPGSDAYSESIYARLSKTAWEKMSYVEREVALDRELNGVFALSELEKDLAKKGKRAPLLFPILRELEVRRLVARQDSPRPRVHRAFIQCATMLRKLELTPRTPSTDLFVMGAMGAMYAHRLASDRGRGRAPPCYGEAHLKLCLDYFSIDQSDLPGFYRALDANPEMADRLGKIFLAGVGENPGLEATLKWADKLISELSEPGIPDAARRIVDRLIFLGALGDPLRALSDLDQINDEDMILLAATTDAHGSARTALKEMRIDRENGRTGQEIRMETLDKNGRKYDTAFKKLLADSNGDVELVMAKLGKRKPHGLSASQFSAYFGTTTPRDLSNLKKHFKAFLARQESG